MSTESLDILIVDDHELTTKALKGYLQTKGYRCGIAVTYEDAMLWVKKCPPCVILDLNIPGEHGGEELIHEFRRYRDNIIIVVATGVNERDDPERIQKVRSLDPTAVLTKPIDPVLLMHLLPTPSSLSVG